MTGDNQSRLEAVVGGADRTHQLSRTASGDTLSPVDPWWRRGRIFAHSPNQGDRWHGLGEHSRATAKLAAEFAGEFGAAELGYALGLMHDAGKASSVWQEALRMAVLRKGPVRMPHKDLGARLLARSDELAAMAALGHHGGLSDLRSLHTLLQQPEDPDDAATVARFLEVVPQAQRFVDGSADLVPASWLGPGRELVRELGLRLVFSALVDADYLDTSAHFQSLSEPVVRAPADFNVLVDRLEQRQFQLCAEPIGSSTGRMRYSSHDAAVRAAQGEPGMYRMTIQTGSGKTFTIAAFAAHHAARHHKARVIIAAPFRTLTAHSADIMRALLDPLPGQERVVLEHHSHVDVDDHAEYSLSQDQSETPKSWDRLTAENWDAPVVVTNMTQLFDSLFGRHPARMRKLHRLTNAVLVLDDVHTVPERVLVPILDVLRTLVEHFGTTVLLTSAAPTGLEELPVWRGLKIHDIVLEAVDPQARLQRVDLQWWEGSQPALADVAKAVRGERQVLVVLNTDRDARVITTLLAGSPAASVMHLSSRMPAHHRRAVLVKAARRLTNDQPLIVVTTQLVEAGLDLDLPVVFRSMAPADSLLQIIGRVNRERPTRVVIFDPSDGDQSSDDNIKMEITRYYFGPDRADPDDLDALTQYYRDLHAAYQMDKGPTHDHRKLPTAQAIQYNRRVLDFRAVADGPLIDPQNSDARDPRRAFRIGDQEELPVVVVHGSKRRRVGCLLRRAQVPDRRQQSALRELQQWTVLLTRDMLDAPDADKLLRPVVGDLHEWLGDYDMHLGINATSFERKSSTAQSGTVQDRKVEPLSG